MGRSDKNMDVSARKKEIDLFINNGQYEEAYYLCEQLLQYKELEKVDELKVFSREVKIIINILKKEKNNKRKMLMQQKLGEFQNRVEDILFIPNLEQEDKKSYIIAMTLKRDMLRKLGRKEEALEVTNQMLSIPNLKQEDKKNYIIAMNQRRDLLRQLGIEGDLLAYEKLLSQKEKIELQNLMMKETQQKDTLSQLFTRVYCNNITLEEMEEANIDDFKKTILFIAYYEKYNKKKGLQFIKQNMNELDENQRKIVNRLKERLLSKKVLFDYGLYASILNTTVDFALVGEITKRKQTPASAKQEVMEIPVYKKETKKKKQKQVTIKVSPKIVTSSQTPPKESKKLVQEKTPKTKQPQVIKEIRMKDIFAEELSEIGMYLYQQMESDTRRQEAIKAWDNLECFSEKIINKKTLEKMLVFLNSLNRQKANPETQFQDIFVNEFTQIETHMISPTSELHFQKLKKANIQNIEAFQQMIDLLYKHQQTTEEEKIARLIKKYY